MSLDRLERVMWRLRSKHPNQDKIPYLALERAIMVECGTDPKTSLNNRKALTKLGWVRFKKRNWVILTGKDLTGDY